jgi:hypothetical protein
MGRPKIFAVAVLLLSVEAVAEARADTCVRNPNDPLNYTCTPTLRDQLERSLRGSTGPVQQMHNVQLPCRDGSGAALPNCYFALRDGQCWKQTLGSIGWNPEQVTPDQCPRDLVQAYCQQYPQDTPTCPNRQAAAQPAAAPTTPAGPINPVNPRPFTLGPGSETDAELRRMAQGAGDRDWLLGQLPPACREEFRRYLSGVDLGEKDDEYARRAVDNYNHLQEVPFCRDALQKIAANARYAPGLPARHLNPVTQQVFQNAMAADPNRPLVGPEIRLEEVGYDMNEVMDFGFTLLGLAGSFAGAAGAMHPVRSFHAGGSGGYLAVPTGGQRAPMYVAPRNTPSTITGNIGN